MNEAQPRIDGDDDIESTEKQDNVHTNTESVQCISIVYSICPYKYNQ